MINVLWILFKKALFANQILVYTMIGLVIISYSVLLHLFWLISIALWCAQLFAQTKLQILMEDASIVLWIAFLAWLNQFVVFAAMELMLMKENVFMFALLEQFPAIINVQAALKCIVLRVYFTTISNDALNVQLVVELIFIMAHVFSNALQIFIKKLYHWHVELAVLDV